MKVLTKRAMWDRWAEAEIPNELEELQKYVDGYIEVYGLTEDMILLCNEEGRINNLPYNTRVMGEEFFGPILVCGTKGEEFTDVPIMLEDWIRYWVGHSEGGTE